jgi:hypothetical protein
MTETEQAMVSELLTALAADMAEHRIVLSGPSWAAYDKLRRVWSRPRDDREPGLPTHVRFAYPDAGYEACQQQAARYLEPGKVYPLAALQVGQPSSTVELLGFRDIRFNSVMFAPARGDEE